MTVVHRLRACPCQHCKIVKKRARFGEPAHVSAQALRALRISATAQRILSSMIAISEPEYLPLTMKQDSLHMMSHRDRMLFKHQVEIMTGNLPFCNPVHVSIMFPQERHHGEQSSPQVHHVG